MWESLSRADVDQARETLQTRREEMQRRHADELSDLDGKRAEIETLERLIAAFAEKFKKPTSSSEAPSDEEPAETRTFGEDPQKPAIVH